MLNDDLVLLFCPNCGERVLHTEHSFQLMARHSDYIDPINRTATCFVCGEEMNVIEDIDQRPDI